jgi:hypothetical protein
MPSHLGAPLRNAEDVTVSVVVTSHNYGHFLEQCIRSVAEQTFRDWELIIVDDGSADDTLDVARRGTALCGEQQVVVVTTRRGGASRARNLGISLARGKYVSCLDADDWYYPSALERMVAEFRGDPSLAVVSSPVDGDENSGGMWGHRPYSFGKLREACLISSCAMFRRDAWQEVGGYDEQMTGYEDWDFWVALGAAGYPMKCLDEILWHYRLRQEGKYYTKSRPRDLELRARIVRNHPAVYRDCCRRLAQRIADGQVTDADVLSCPHPIFSSSFRAEAAMRRAEEAVPDNAREDVESSPVLMAQPCLVPFQDCSQRAGGIGWAQQVQWGSIGRWLADGRGEPDGLCFGVDVPAGTAIGDFLTAIGRLVSRHESLRTRFQSAEGRLVRQEAVGNGYADVTIYRVRAGHVPTEELLQRQVRDEMLDIESGFPFRAGFVTAGGEVTHAAFVVSRVVADAAACENLGSSFISELSAIKAGKRPAVFFVHGHVVTARHDDKVLPGAAFQQLDQVEWEAGAEGSRAERQALDYLREQMTAIQALPRPAVIDNGTVHSAVVPAESVLTAANEVARVSGTSSSAVLLTAFLQAAAQILHLEGLGCYLHCSNRTDVKRQGSVTRLKNLTVYAYSPSSSDFTSAVRQVFRGSLKAYRHAQSPGELFFPRLGVALEDGPFIHFNDVRSVVAMDELPVPEQLAEPQAGVADTDEPAITETSRETARKIKYAPTPVLSLAVGGFMGVSKRPLLTIETNLMRSEGISLLLERMNCILVAAAVPSAGS